VDLTKTFSAEHYGRALASWRWLGIDRLTPRFTSLFGDIFFWSEEGWWYLSTLEGSLDLLWRTDVELFAELATEEGQDSYLLGVFSMAAARRGLLLGPGDVYVFAPPPVFGGPIAVENMMVLDFAVSAAITGQMHQQLNEAI
jgi:hypothetical protein